MAAESIHAVTMTSVGSLRTIGLRPLWSLNLAVRAVGFRRRRSRMVWTPHASSNNAYSDPTPLTLIMSALCAQCRSSSTSSPISARKLFPASLGAGVLQQRLGCAYSGLAKLGGFLRIDTSYLVDASHELLSLDLPTHPSRRYLPLTGPEAVT